MDLSAMLKLPLSANSGWQDLLNARLSLRKILFMTMLPIALLPPVLLYFTGIHHPELLPHAVENKFWGEIAAVFFLAEIATALAMGWSIKQVAKIFTLSIDQKDALLVAAIAPVPMWISSLGLLLPNFVLSMVIVFGGLGLTCGMTYNGILAICGSSEELEVASIVQTVIGGCLAFWGCLLAFAML